MRYTIYTSIFVREALCIIYIYLRKPMAAGLIILDWKEVFEGWLVIALIGVGWPEVDTPICVFCGWFWVCMILLLNSLGRGDITACGVGRRGVSDGADTLWVATS